MSFYTDFSRDSIKRTKINIQEYQGKYEVTHLINSCLGLIVIPKELFVDKLSNEPIYERDESYGINQAKNSILDTYADKEDKVYGLKNIIRHIRNGLSHGHLEQKKDNDKISGFRIFDSHRGNETFSIELTINEFKQFALRVSDDFLA